MNARQIRKIVEARLRIVSQKIANFNYAFRRNADGNLTNKLHRLKNCSVKFRL
jgi:hypothetical protein